MWGGHYGPDDHKQLYSLYKIMARATKILDFVPFYVWMVTGKLFLDFFFWKFEKMKKKIWQLWLQRVPLWKKSWKFQKMYFVFKNFVFIFWIYILHILNFHLIYIQPWPLAYKRLLNKPYVNEVNLTGQKPPLKYCRHLEIQYPVKKRVDLLMLKILGL